MNDERRRLELKFAGPALEEWRKAWPEMPPGDEVALFMYDNPCDICGNKVTDQEIGGIDPEYITEEGELVGKIICGSCMEEGH